ncbi:MAG: MBL fold metallo-hydrolase [Gammaproteobacteria bacterium]|nr:MBL fold metallo-hydrolase [Gammaproteobacteria bacterium]
MSLQVAQQWYDHRDFDDEITLIWEPHVSISVRCNIWLVKGRDKQLLIDNGMGMKPMRSEITALTEKPVLAVASHAHFDHIGGHHEFEYRLSHAAEADILTTPNDKNTVWHWFKDEALIDALPSPGYDMSNYSILPAPPTQLIDEGDEIDLGNRVFKVFHLPGHSPGSICLYEQSTRTLFTGDVIYDGKIYDQLYHSDVEIYLETMARLKEIPAEILHCGHYGSFGKQRLIELVDAYVESKHSL